MLSSCGSFIYCTTTDMCLFLDGKTPSKNNSIEIFIDGMLLVLGVAVSRKRKTQFMNPMSCHVHIICESKTRRTPKTVVLIITRDHRERIRLGEKIPSR
jgi:hypothetical protein